MKRTTTLFLILLTASIASAQTTTKDYAVMIQATVSVSPPSITLTWKNISNTRKTKIYRKNKNTNQWGGVLFQGTSTTTQYIDYNVTVGSDYEYYIKRIDSANFADGYIYTGIKLPETTYRGKLLLMVDANYSAPLTMEIAQLQNDLIADGWQVKRFDIARNATVTSVKNIIKSEIIADANTKALYLLGRIPVPYSGGFKAANGYNYPPDGHPDHGGAWPADMYYGVLNESLWTDTQVKDTSASRTNNRNIPGDGKFDQMDLNFNPDTVALQIGRVDLTNMNTFGMSDTNLVRQYLNKAHNYKTGKINVVRRGLVDDNFGVMSGEAFASSGYRDFSTMFGDSVFGNRDYITSIKKGNYLFTYGCGAGSYTTCSGIGATSDFNNDSINTVFTMLFGSYFGDWDSPNNFLRAPLCSRPSALASVWSGRPHWHFHHMSLGENIGYSARLTQNNYWDTTPSVFGYVYNIYPSFIHIALMGDPSLRLHSMIPSASVKAVSSTDSMSVKLTWKPSVDATDGYVILSSRSLNGKFLPIGKALSTDTTFTDLTPGYGMNYYLVRPLKLETTPSGTYYNMALGVMDSARSVNKTGVNEFSKTKLDATVFPNPSNGKFTVYVRETLTQNNSITCFDLTGRILLEKTFMEDNTHIDLSSFSRGIYFLKIKSGTMETMKKIVVE